MLLLLLLVFVLFYTCFYIRITIMTMTWVYHACFVADGGPFICKLYTPPFKAETTSEQPGSGLLQSQTEFVQEKSWHRSIFTRSSTTSCSHSSVPSFLRAYGLRFRVLGLEYCGGTSGQGWLEETKLATGTC